LAGVSRPLLILAGAALVVGALYFARAILLPFALGKSSRVSAKARESGVRLL